MKVMYVKLNDLINNIQEVYKKKVKPIHTFYPRIINETAMILSKTEE